MNQVTFQNWNKSLSETSSLSWNRLLKPNTKPILNITHKENIMADQVQEQRKPFTVNAGKLEYYGEDLYKNSKYCDDFATLDEALVAVKKCEGYSFIDLAYTDVQGVRWDVVLTTLK
jgi:hypothetical protein